MKILLRLFKRLTNWINYPTSRERMWGMYALGKAQGIKEALKTLPIVQVQPKQETEPLKVHLPPGEWSRLYREAHGLQAAPPQDDSWLNSKPSVKQAFDPYSTEEMPAVVKLLHERRYETRKLE